MNLSDKHLYLTSGADMRALINPLKKYNIDYFTYNKNYFNGGSIRLTTHTDHLKSFLKNEYYKIGNIDAHPKYYDSQIMFLSGLKNQFLVDWLRLDYGIGNGMYIVKKGKDFTEFFCFAMPARKQDATNFYLNNLNFFQNFCMYFKDQAQTLILKAEKNLLVHDFHMQPGIENPIRAELPLYYGGSHIKLTPRESEVVRHLLAGLRIKEIAYQVNLNPRTIEDYVAKLRGKFQARSMVELILKLTQGRSDL